MKRPPQAQAPQVQETIHGLSCEYNYEALSWIIIGVEAAAHCG